jgi:phenylacetate-CoA ligase
LERLNALLHAIWEGNAFYKARWLEAGLTPGSVASIDDLAKYPTLRKADLLADQAAYPPYGSSFTFDQARFTRIHRSSGTTGRPLLWLDDEASWQALLRSSVSAYRMAGVSPSDRLFLSARFGPSLGPWLLRSSAYNLGCLCIAPGEIPIAQELQLLRDLCPNVLVGKPGKIHSLAQAAMAAGNSPQSFGVKKIITVSEPGGSEHEIRGRIESAWDAECFDRYGMTEAGTIAAECTAHPGGLHMLDEEILAEVLHPEEDVSMPDGAEGELVLTHLGRIGQPIVRYRTGDRTCRRRHPGCCCGLLDSTLISSITRNMKLPSAVPSP